MANRFRLTAYGQWSCSGSSGPRVIDVHIIYSTSVPYSVMATETHFQDLVIHKDGSLSGDVLTVQKDLEDTVFYFICYLFHFKNFFHSVIFEVEVPVVATPLPRPVKGGSYRRGC
eukprot:GHVN01071024.1.p1 GENE.GHVN01071024.1~~GHVN01071024.1.p1  ORF type:complete len:115 (+),score=2.71 GHVN01071024.1:159-503(+)